MYMAQGRIARVIAVLYALLLIPSAIVLAQDVFSNIEAKPPLRVKGAAQSAVVGYTPSQIRRAYGFDLVSNQGAGQTIAIITAYDHPHIEEDLAVFSETFNLPPCTTQNGCFRKIAAGANPGTKQIWTLEAALDVEWAHAIAPQARILLVQAKNDKLSELLDAVDFAVFQGASVVSMSWGALETPGTSQGLHFDRPNVTFIASSGDFGAAFTLFPAASPFVTAVGGTTLNIDGLGHYISETAWSGSGGGLSIAENEPLYQATFDIPNNPLGKRGIPDVAYDANFETGFAVYNSHPWAGLKGWLQIAGTSAGAPQWAGLAAIANSLRAAAGKPPMTGMNNALYNAAKNDYETNFHDVTTGTNGSCLPLCRATAGYDYLTGLGSPKANNLINALVQAP
jgi:subtilase family serine protease